ncbi:hypothetical protein [Brevundimonas diminuta]|uniref:hypothetical protein n=1 Tax=Brevundimonas diminuta TaxID=293 RepID=UPI001177DA5A|nr:hypothetical protein [Brevundimonas diminuta]
MAIVIANTHLADLESASLDDLFGELGMASFGADADVSSALGNLSGAKAIVLKGGWMSFVERGIAFFRSIWPTVKPIVCAAYAEYTESDGDWIGRIAGAILGVINVTAAVAVLILKIAIKQGLDTLCEA